MNTLQQIQQLQFSDKSAAEALLLRFMRESLGLEAASVELRPLAVSLNSFNGFITLQGNRRLFFKTHTEADGIIGEYYNAAQLAAAGYPILQPVYTSTEAGKQLLIYDVIADPSVFDLAWQIECGDNVQLGALTQAQQQADDQLFTIYQHTLEWMGEAQNASAPVHQLFHHRLTQGRLTRFYGSFTEDMTILLPNRESPFKMRDVQQVRWEINGQYYAETLDQIIHKAIHLLDPAQNVPSVIGHGDAHNGNVFYRQETQSLLYFDPAFAGRHDPLLDVVKPLFHNVFAMWMYFPKEKAKTLAIRLEQKGDSWVIGHNYQLHRIREMFLESKVQRVLIPSLLELKRRNWLREDWRDYLKCALFCCPFLTMNLADSAKFLPEISLLGLCMAVEMGADSAGQRSLIDQVLDVAAEQLA
jgi:hypothetical protein